MPMVIGDVFINSEADIPEKYRQAVYNNLDSNHIYKRDTINGEFGEATSSYEEIKQIFLDSKYMFFGHGTIGDEEVLKSIVENGLHVKNSASAMGYDSHLRGLESTTIVFGEGSGDLFDNSSDRLNNWPHLSSTKIVIISLPMKYIIPRYYINQADDQFENFYIPNEINGFSVMPEYINGVYDSENKSFTPNSRFYERLSKEEQEEIDKYLLDKYIEVFAKKTIVSPEEVDLPLKNEQKERLIINWYSAQLLKLREQEKLKLQQLDDMFDIKEDFGFEEDFDFEKWK